jgi:hypothetical protein
MLDGRHVEPTLGWLERAAYLRLAAVLGWAFFLYADPDPARRGAFAVVASAALLTAALANGASLLRLRLPPRGGWLLARVGVVLEALAAGAALPPLLAAVELVGAGPSETAIPAGLWIRAALLLGILAVIAAAVGLRQWGRAHDLPAVGEKVQSPLKAAWLSALLVILPEFAAGMGIARVLMLTWLLGAWVVALQSMRAVLRDTAAAPDSAGPEGEPDGVR